MPARMDVTARRPIAAAPARVHEHLAALENHWRLGGRQLRLTMVQDDGRGGEILIRGPFGIRRHVRTTLTIVRSPTVVAGVAAVGTDTRARVRWRIRPVGKDAIVDLRATVETTSAVDAILLALGGRRWLRSRFGEALERLASAVEQPAVAAVVRAERDWDNCTHQECRSGG